MLISLCAPETITRFFEGDKIWQSGSGVKKCISLSSASWISCMLIVLFGIGAEANLKNDLQLVAL